VISCLRWSERSTMNGAPHYFVSYCSKDKEFVRRLVKTLRDAHVSVWLDQSDIQAGEPWDTKVQEALEKCDGVIVILSPDSVKSRNVLDEIGYAVGANKNLIPVVYKKCITPLRLNRLNRIDLSEEGDEGLNVLVKCLRLGAPLPQTARAGLDTSTIPFSVEDAMAFLSVAPRGLIKQLIAAADSVKWHDRLYILLVLKGLGPFFPFWAIFVSLVLDIASALVFPETLVFAFAWGAFSILWIIGATWFFGRYLSRLRTQVVGLTLGSLLPRRPPGEINANRTERLWVRAKPILWEVAALPFASWGEYLESIRVDQELRQQVNAFLSLFIAATQSLRRGE